MLSQARKSLTRTGLVTAVSDPGADPVISKLSAMAAERVAHDSTHEHHPPRDADSSPGAADLSHPIVRRIMQMRSL